MEGRTQLIIDGVEVVLPLGFSTTVKRENSFFTKNGEYTYECSLSLDNQTNRQLYGFLQRLNKKDAVASKRSAILMADGKVYCRGTEVITGWTSDEVNIQVVSGNSELNYFIGDSLKIEWLDMGEIAGDPAAPFRYNSIASNPCYPDLDYCLPTVYNSTADKFYNIYIARGLFSDPIPLLAADAPDAESRSGILDVRPQPYLCALVRRLIEALNYTIGQNQLEQTQFKNLFVVNIVDTQKYAEMLPGWTVKDFLEEVEKLCNVCFIVDNDSRQVDILQKSVFYANSSPRVLSNVVDEYELEVSDDSDGEWSSSDISYDLPESSADFALLRLSSAVKKSSRVIGYYNVPDDVARFSTVTHYIYRDKTTGRCYICRRPVSEADFISYDAATNTYSLVFPAKEALYEAMRHDNAAYTQGFFQYLAGNALLAAIAKNSQTPLEYGNNPTIAEVDQFADLSRDDSVSSLTLKLLPAPMRLMPAYLYWYSYDSPRNPRGTYNVLRPGLASVVVVGDNSADTTTAEPSTDSEETATADSSTFEQFIVDAAEAAEEAAGTLYCAFYLGLQEHRHGYLPQAYTDAHHALSYDEFWHQKEDSFPQSLTTRSMEGSLRLTDVDADVYGGVYRVDTSRRVTFETFDPNLADPRAVYVIRNRRYVCREIEETLTAHGRKPRWKMTCHPIELSDVAADSRWVLTKGVWDDGGVWLDDGRWND